MADVTKDTLVLVVDDLPLRREFIVRFVERWAAEMDLAAASSNLDDVLALKRLSGYRLVVLSHGADSLSEPKLAAARQVLVSVDPDRPVVILGDRPDLENIERALESGMAGYVPTSLEPEVAIAALSFVLAGGSYYPAEALLRIGNQPKDKAPIEAPQIALPSGDEPSQCQRSETGRINGDDGCRRNGADAEPEMAAATSGDLTLRQRQVLACLKQARSNKEIARELAMSEATVKVHVRHVMKKLGALNRTHAAVLAARDCEAGEPILTNVSAFTAPLPLQKHAVRN